MQMENKNSNPMLLVVAAMVSCVALAEFGHLVSLPGKFATFWPNAGLMLALILNQPVRRWGWVLLGALLANLISDVVLHQKSVAVAASFWFANSIETLVAAGLCRWISNDRFALTTVRRVVQFVLLPCAMGTAVGASLGAAVVSMAFGDPYSSSWKMWWSGDFIGMLVVFPLANSAFSAWLNRDNSDTQTAKKPVWRSDAVLLLGLLVLHGLITVYIFGYQKERLAYAVYPTLLWIVIRFGLVGVNVGVLVTAVIMVAFTANGHGLFGGIADLTTRAFVVQVFLFVTSATFLTLAASMLERQQAVASLVTTKQQLEAYVELIGTTDGSWSWDIVTDEVQFSARYREMLGYQADDIEKFPNSLESFSNSVHPDDREFLWQQIQKHFDEGGIFQAEYRLEMSDGAYRWFHVRANTTRSGDGKPVVMAGSTFDITDRKEVELQLNRSNKDLAQFAYVASHDLQEPLRAVAGFCQLLARRYSSSLDERAQGYIASAVEGASRMSILIQDLLAFSRVGNENRPFVPVDLNDVMTNVCNVLSMMISESGANIECADDLPTVPGDRQMLTQLFQNLLSNAIKFRRVEVPLKISVTAQLNGGFCEISVQDNGVGIDPAYHDQIFAMFQRLYRREEVSGTGIGLAVCKRIVDRHLGKIQVESEGNHGSRFVVQLPLQEKRDA